MACIQYPRKERGGVNPGSWEKPTIYREPPKEIMTRKKERIEEGDVTYNLRNNPSRYDDAITNWQKGKNMMVSVDYQNRTQQTTTMNFGSASNPYKVNQSFRPPMFRQIDLQPLSRQQRPYTAAQSNIGSDVTRVDGLEFRFDKTEVEFNTKIDPLHAQANANVSREMGVYYDNFERKDMINEDYVSKQVVSQLKGLESVELQKLFSYENTPNGIVLTPLSISASAVLSANTHVESQRNMGEHQYIQDQRQVGLGSNQRGITQLDQRHINDEHTYLQHALNVATYSNANANITVQQDQNGDFATRDAVYHTAHSNPNRNVALQQEQNGDFATRDVVQVGQGSNVYSNIAVQQGQNGEFATKDAMYVGQGSNPNRNVGFQDQRDGHQDSFVHQDLTRISGEATKRGPVNVEHQRHVAQGDAYLQQTMNYEQGVNKHGGQQHTDAQRNIQDYNYVQHREHHGLGSNQSGVKRDGDRNMNEQDFVQHRVQVGHGTNTKGHNHVDSQRYVQEQDYVQQRQQIGLGANQASIQVQAIHEHQDQMKDVLLKNMSSSVSIVIQKAGSSDEYQIHGNIKDKIGIVIHSTKGAALTLNRENGEPIKLKDYTWKFIKSASGSDKFVIQVAHDELQLERKAELYAMYANPHQSAKVNHDGDEVSLRREVRTMSAATNLILSGDLNRVDESVLVNRVEKQTNYTDMMIQTTKPTLDRDNGLKDAIRGLESSKRGNIQRTVLSQSQGRFDS